MAHAGGRPSKYSEDLIDKVDEYLAECEDEETEFHKTRGEKSDSYDRIIRVKLPKIETLALRLGVNEDTLVEWGKIYPEFSAALNKVRKIQHDRLINNSLAGTYNPVIAKLMLSSNHGYREKQDIDHTTKGDKIDSSNEIKELTKQLNALHRGTGIRSDGTSSNAVDTEA